MLTSHEFQGVLKGFQLDNPNATWDDLKEALRDVADGLMSKRVEPQYLSGHYDLLEDHLNTLAQIASTMPLTPQQALSIKAAREILKAGQRKLQGHPEDLAGIIQNLQDEHGGSDVLQPASLSSSVRTSIRPSKTVSFRALSDSYLSEHSVNVKPSTLTQVTSIIKTLNAAFETCEVLDVANHTRADLVRVKAYLGGAEGGKARSVSTVNNFIMMITTILSYGVSNGLIKHNYSQRLKTVKGASSERKAFTAEQVDTLLALAYGRTAEVRWACSLAAVTGARLQEVLQLRKGDILIDPKGQMAMHINEDAEGKSVKNDGSVRTVPLVTTSKWFDAAAFKAYLEGFPTGTDKLFNQKSLPKILNALVKAAVGPDKNLVFHSLRHTVAGLLQSNGIILQTSAAILGHKTGSMTFDVYGTTMGQEPLREALEKVLPTTMLDWSLKMAA